MIKSILILILSLFLLLCFLIIFDTADYDSSFVNRKALVFSSKNLNSRHSHRIISLLESNFKKIATKVSKKYNEKWSIESEKKRLEYPLYKITPAKKTNFSKSINRNEDYNNYSDWLRSHGNNFSTRFSALKNINKKNVNKLELNFSYVLNYIFYTSFRLEKEWLRHLHWNTISGKVVANKSNIYFDAQCRTCVTSVYHINTQSQMF